MAEPGQDDESQGNPSTPKKTTARAKERKIVRWTDEKIAICFADFRVACQKHRIDIKKPLEEAAKMVEDFVTADALVQQLSKRRARFYADKKASEEADKEEQEGRATELALKKLSEKITDVSPASAKKGAPKRRKTALQAEVEQLNDDGAPSPHETSSQIIVQTPKSSSKRKPRGTATRARKDSIQKIKKENDTQVLPLIKASSMNDHDDDDNSESEYCESPIKTKKKRVRAKRSATKKVQTYAEDEVEIETPRDDGFDISFDSVYVDEAGGENTIVKSGLSDKSPEDVKYASKYAPRTSSLNPHHGRRDSYQSYAISSQSGHAAHPSMAQMEDVFVEQSGTQLVNTRPLNPNAPSFGMGYESGYGDNPFMMHMQQNMGNMYGQAYDGGMMTGHYPQLPMPDSDSGPSEEYQGGGLQDSFAITTNADTSFLYDSFNTLPDMGQVVSLDTLNPLQAGAYNSGHGHGYIYHPGFIAESDEPTPSKPLADGLEKFNI